MVGEIEFADATGGRVIERKNTEGVDLVFAVTASFVVTISPERAYSRRELAEVLAENIVADFGETDVFADLIDRIELIERRVDPGVPAADEGDDDGNR